MKVRLGYVSISTCLNVTSSTNLTYTEYEKNKDFNKLDEIIKSNLNDLYEILKYNKENNIHFYRMSSKLIPLATHQKVDFDYINKYKLYYKKLGKFIKENNMRIDMHPDQFAVLNSTKKEVIDNTIEILKYQYNILNELDIDDKVIILHIGSSVFGKENSIKRFINSFNKLNDNLKKSIVIENDDKIYNVIDTLNLAKTLNIPMVLDYHHHTCNNNDIDLYEYIKDIFDTWKITPKIHFSSPKNKKEFRSHNDYIDIDVFIEFMERIKHLNIDLDVMIEAKQKDNALFTLVRLLKYKTNYKFIDETTFLVE